MLDFDPPPKKMSTYNIIYIFFPKRECSSTPGYGLDKKPVNYILHSSSVFLVTYNLCDY